jgi:hypothetical protein
MSHLTDETLARLIDEAPTALEAAHLAACGECRDELQAMHVQVAELSVLPELQPPPADWEKLERRLAAEGLIRAHAPRRIWLHYGLRAAAAAALLLTGTLLGQRLQPTSAAPATPVASSDAAPAGDTRPLVEPPVTLAEAEPAPEQTSPSPATLVSHETVPAARPLPRTSEEAYEYVRQAEAHYLDALTRFAELSGATSIGDPAARLAALEGIVLTTRAALGQAPTDAVINGYYLNAVAQRDATLRQISATSGDSWF